jgi:hypothetical protein
MIILAAGRGTVRRSRLVAEQVQRFHHCCEIVQHRPQLCQQAVADVSQGDAAGPAIEQPRPQLLLQRAQRLAQSRARDAEMRRRLGKLDRSAIAMKALISANPGLRIDRFFQLDHADSTGLSNKYHVFCGLNGERGSAIVGSERAASGERAVVADPVEPIRASPAEIPS